MVDDMRAHKMKTKKERRLGFSSLEIQKHTIYFQILQLAIEPLIFINISTLLYGSAMKIKYFIFDYLAA